MREIKFRAWEKPGIVASDKTGTRQFDGKMWNENSIDFIGYCLGRPHEYDVMQFTGLHDKNGKEIYEGDVVRQVPLTGEQRRPYYSTGVVAYRDTEAQFVVEEKAGYALTNLRTFGVTTGEAEIIGDIYSKPELITKK
jgi:uncharacterized phage protein (TIGR01671 family)